MIFPKENELVRLRHEFPVGSRIVLDEMNDPYRQMPAGLQGVCRGVDDAGNVMACWDNGSSLSVAYGADKCHRVASEAEVKESLEWLGKAPHRGARCSRCGAEAQPGNRLLALSRRADIQICERCGSAEALEDAGFLDRKPLTDWAIVRKGWVE